MQVDSVTRYEVVDGKWKDSGVVATLNYEKVEGTEGLKNCLIYSSGFVYTDLCYNNDLKIDDVLGLLPVKLRPSSSRNLVVSGSFGESVVLEIGSSGVIKVIKVGKKGKIEEKRRVVEIEKVEESKKIESIIRYDSKDRKEIEVVEKIDPRVVVSIPGRSGLKIGDIVGTVEKDLIPKKNCHGFTVDVKGNGVVLLIDTKGVIKVKKIEGTDETVSLNQFIFQYRLN